MQNDRLFFPYQDGADLEDRYEELLFEDKQFFGTKAIVPKVFRARIEKMHKREDAFRRITGINTKEENPKILLRNDNSFELLSNYLNFQKDRALLFQQMYKTSECLSLIYLIEQLIERFLSYAQAWELQILGNVEAVFIAKELDPSELYAALASFSAAGGKNVKEIQSLFFQGKVLLENEAKRLSLLLENENK